MKRRDRIDTAIRIIIMSISGILVIFPLILVVTLLIWRRITEK